MMQDEKFISSREKLKEYFSFRKYLGNSSSYIKTSGNAFNGIKNGNLNDDDLAKVKAMVLQMKQDHKDSGIALKDFEKELKRIAK